MGTSVTGRVVDESGNSIADPIVVGRDEFALFSSGLGNTVPDGNRNCTVPTGTELPPRSGTRQLGVYGRTGVRKNAPAGREFLIGRLPCSRTSLDRTGAYVTWNTSSGDPSRSAFTQLKEGTSVAAQATRIADSVLALHVTEITATSTRVEVTFAGTAQLNGIITVHDAQVRGTGATREHCRGLP